MRPQAWFATLVFAFLAWGLLDGLSRSFLGGIYTIGIAVAAMPVGATTTSGAAARGSASPFGWSCSATQRSTATG